VGSRSGRAAAPRQRRR